jgi:hypothetical protein
MPLVTRFQLKPNCLLVDAYDLDGPDFNYANRKPAVLLAHVMDKSPTLQTPPQPAKYTPLNNVQAFIARFIVMGVDTDPMLYLHKIIASEYKNMDEAKAKKEIKDVVALLGPYVEERKKDRPYKADPVGGPGQHQGKYDLDFKVNLMGTGVFKGPL